MNEGSLVVLMWGYFYWFWSFFIGYFCHTCGTQKLHAEALLSLILSHNPKFLVEMVQVEQATGLEMVLVSSKLLGSPATR
jgi:hypothetical protein